MNVVTCQTIYYDNEKIQHTASSYDVFWEKLPASNLSEIRDAESVHNVVILNDKIIQAGGYSQDRGLFVDLY